MGLSASARNSSQRNIWKSERLKNSRRVWIFTTGEQQQKNVRWQFCSMANFGRKDARLACADFADPSSATSSRRYVLIDAIDTTHRAHELPCNAISGWQYSKSYYPW